MRNLKFWYSGKRVLVINNENQPAYKREFLLIRTRGSNAESNAETQPRLPIPAWAGIPWEFHSTVCLLFSICSLQPLILEVELSPTFNLQGGSVTIPIFFMFWVSPETDPQFLSVSIPDLKEGSLALMWSGDAWRVNHDWGGWVQQLGEERANASSELPQKGELLWTWQTPIMEKERNNSSFTSINKY